MKIMKTLVLYTATLVMEGVAGMQKLNQITTKIGTNTFQVQTIIFYLRYSTSLMQQGYRYNIL